MTTTSAPVAASTGPASAAGGAVGRVDDDAQAVEAPPLEHVDDVLAIGRAVLDVDQLGRVAAGRGQRQHVGLDALLDVVAELPAAGGEQLDPVVPVGVVRCRDHPAEAVAAGGLEGHDRRRHDAEAVDDDALAGQAGDEGGLQHRRGEAGVAADDGLRPAEHPRRGAAEVEGEGGGEVGVGDAADAVGPELHVSSARRAGLSAS